MLLLSLVLCTHMCVPWTPGSLQKRGGWGGVCVGGGPGAGALGEAPGLLTCAGKRQSHLAAVPTSESRPCWGVSASSPHVSCVHVKTTRQQCGPSVPGEPGPNGKCPLATRNGCLFAKGLAGSVSDYPLLSYDSVVIISWGRGSRFRELFHW